MKRRRLIVLTLAVLLLAVVLLTGISQWSDSTAGENAAYYAADAARVSGNIDRGVIARGEYLDRKSVV